MKEQKPLVSFILTYYSLPVQMLCECINSILALSLQPAEREIIVVDDGSEVSPMNGLMQYGDTIIYVRQKHSGVSASRNTGMNMAHGEYIQFVDGDDYLIQAPYDNCLDLIRHHPHAEIVMFDFTNEKNDKVIIQEPIRISGTELMRNHNIHGATCCCLFRQSIRGSLAFTPGIAYAEDEEFTAQLLLRAEVVYVTKACAYFYRQRETSAVHQLNEDSVNKRLNDTCEIIKKLHETADTLPNNERLALQRRIAQLTMDYIYNTIMLTQSYDKVNSRVNELHDMGLYPLPNQNYSAKYIWFRRLANTKIGLRMLLHTLPHLKREK